MYLHGKYRETDKMCDLVYEHYRVLLVMSRFGIGLGFGDKTIGEVCRETGVDVRTFMAVVDVHIFPDDEQNVNILEVSVEALLAYLHLSHDYFLQYRLPGIHAKLEEILCREHDVLAKAILLYFDEYVAEVSRHMTYEEKTVFPYVRALLSGKQQKRYSITMFEKQHDRIELRLKEFKQIIIRFYPSQSTNEINSVLFDIFNCEQDLAAHNKVENSLLIPAIMKIERQHHSKKHGRIN
ncbi:MAG: hemerythrin domain-containing protein [Bacteroidales bacterium]|jgi:regulator of cell morphogenesis and NO signaling|nr:hemerythrin domain-containing protein [Bacteroidales bacterium]